MKYTLNDIFIVPADVSIVSSRKEPIPYTNDGFLPLFTAPMSSVVDLNNYNLFKNNRIIPIIPRTIDLNNRFSMCTETWCAFSLTEAEILINEFPMITKGKTAYVLIDIANGHMLKLHDLIKEFKFLYGDNIKIMAGNVANPKTYGILSEAGADYVRIGIGTGSVCITSSNTAIHFPMASLIKECNELSNTLKTPAYIVADGGIKGYSDIIKALALGADYVMCGSIFNKMLESAGDTYQCNVPPEKVGETWGLRTKIDQYSTSKEYFLKYLKDDLYKEHYGMSTKRAQNELGNSYIRTSEGIEIFQKVEYTMSQWVENFEDYLRSTMSYTSSFTLGEFIGNVETIIVSNNSLNSINK